MVGNISRIDLEGTSSCLLSSFSSIHAHHLMVTPNSLLSIWGVGTQSRTELLKPQCCDPPATMVWYEPPQPVSLEYQFYRKICKISALVPLIPAPGGICLPSSVLGFSKEKFGKYSLCGSLTLQSQTELHVTLCSIANWLCVLSAPGGSLLPILQSNG